DGSDGAGKHTWTEAEKLRPQYEHSLWRTVGDLAKKLGGHGGMDYIMNYRLVQLYRQGKAPDIDVYDTAAWSAPGPLSDISVAHGSIPLPFPDFTRRKWKDKASAAEWNKNLCDSVGVLRAPSEAPAKV
ncbi:MAG TPA: hypothetical protein VEJ63_12365, partial [Planctomycetota bacterium]|nr:hypothetical protein [Planctomycetota bacterium]